MADQWTRQQRFREFLGRLQQLPPAASLGEAMQQLTNVLNAVEDEFSGIPYDQDRWQSDGRMYPPVTDSRREVTGHPLVVRYRSRGHDTFFGANGSIEIRRVEPGRDPRTGTALLVKNGADGKDVWHQRAQGGKQ